MNQIMSYDGENRSEKDNFNKNYCTAYFRSYVFYFVI